MFTKILLSTDFSGCSPEAREGADPEAGPQDPDKGD